MFSGSSDNQTTATYTGLSPETTYEFTISVSDNAGNESVETETITLTTPPSQNTSCSGESNVASQGTFNVGYTYSFVTQGNSVVIEFELLDSKVDLKAYLQKENPFDFTKFIFKSAIHTVLLNPFHIFSDNNFRSGEIYYGSDTHQKLIIPRIIYTSIIYFFVMIGIFQFYKRDKVNFYLISIIFLYFYGLVSWHGNTRYFVPCLIYLAFYFSFGFDYLAKLIKKNI